MNVPGPTQEVSTPMQDETVASGDDAPGVTGMDLVVPSREADAVGPPLPGLREAEAVVIALVEAGSADDLDEARRRAEAYSLYEKRAQNQERADHYSKLRLLAEAGLGVLSFDDASLIDVATRMSSYRALAAALERRQLLAVCERRSGAGDGGLATDRVVSALRYGGYTSVPGKAFDRLGSIRWAEARVIAKERGINPSTLPLDRAASQRRSRASLAQSRRMNEMYRAAERARRVKVAQACSTAAEARGPRTDVAYGLLRRTLQAFDAALSESSGDDRAWLESAIESMHQAEDNVGKALRIVAPDDYAYRRQRQAHGMTA